MHLKLSQLTNLIEATLSNVFYGKVIAVIAETSEIKKSGNGHYYFDLIEKDGRNVVAKMNAVIWKGYSEIIQNFEATTGQKFERNIELLLKVEVRYHEVFGLQLQVVDIDSKYTLGKLELERQQTLQKLVAENPTTIELINGEYVTKNKKLLAPIVFQRIALITAPNSDGQRDIKHELENNPYGYKFHITEFLTQIQGNNADQLIIQKIAAVAKNKNDFDALVIVRGGGSQIDFAAFDTYEMGKIIAEFDLPVIAGIGHERNVSIADLMCYASVKTPTKAANFLIENNANFEAQILAFQSSMTETISSKLDDENKNLQQLIDDLKFHSQNCIDKQNHRLEKFEIALKHLNPDNILKRGFAIVMKNNKIISNPELIKKGDTINVLLKNHEFTADVTNNSIKK